MSERSEQKIGEGFGQSFSPDSMLGGSHVAEAIPWRRIGATIAVGAAYLSTSGCIEEVKNVQARGVNNNSTPIQSIPRINPTSTLDLPSMAEVADVMDYIDRNGVCPHPDKVGKLRVGNPLIKGGVCPGK